MFAERGVREIPGSSSTDRRRVVRVNSKPITALAGRPSTYAPVPRRAIRKVKLDALSRSGVTRYRYPGPEANVTPVYARVAGDRAPREEGTVTPRRRGLASFIRRLLRESSEIITESAAAPVRRVRMHTHA